MEKAARGQVTGLCVGVECAETWNDNGWAYSTAPTAPRTCLLSLSETNENFFPYMH